MVGAVSWLVDPWLSVDSPSEESKLVIRPVAGFRPLHAAAYKGLHLGVYCSGKGPG
jgi:hypothetical protein